MKKSVRHRNSVIVIWTASYVTIFIIPVMVCFIIYFMSSQMIQSQVRSVGRLSLQTVRGKMDAEISRVMNDSFEVRYHNDFNWLSEVSHFREADAYRLKLAVDGLRAISAVKEGIDSICLYFPSSNIIMSSVNTQDLDRYYDYYYSEFPHQKQEWLALVRGDYAEGQIRTINLYEQAHGRIEVYFIKSSHPPEPDAGYNTIMRFSPALLSSTFGSDTIYEDSILMMLNEDAEPLYSESSVELPAELRARIAGKPDGFLETTINDIPFVAIHMQSQVLPVHYLMLVSQESFYNQYAAMRYMIFAIGILSLLVGIFMIIMFVRLNYNPLRRLLESLQRESIKEDGANRGNEYYRIAEAIHTLHNEKSEIDRRVYQQGIALRSSLVARMLHGIEQFGLSTQEAIEQNGIQLGYNYFAVVTISIDDVALEHFLNDKEMELDQVRRHHLVHRRVQNVCGNVMVELLAESYTCYSANTDGMTSCILNMESNDRKLYRKRVNAAAKVLLELMRDRFDSTVTVTASDIMSGMATIPEAYSQISFSLENGRHFDESHAVFYADIQSSMPGAYYYPQTVERQIITLIELGDTESLRTLIDEIMERNTGWEYNIGVDMAKFLASNILGTLFKASDFISRQDQKELAPVMKSAGGIHACKSMDELRQRLSDAVEQYAALLDTGARTQDTDQADRTCEDIERYIHENYMDQALSVATLAEALGLNPSYASRLMRRVRNVGLLDYINSYRIGKAKEIMAGRDDCTVEDVALEVGFATAKTFTRCFKKFEGITPGKFRPEQ